MVKHPHLGDGLSCEALPTLSLGVVSVIHINMLSILSFLDSKMAADGRAQNKEHRKMEAGMPGFSPAFS
jgi:hypothetical protein